MQSIICSTCSRKRQTIYYEWNCLLINSSKISNWIVCLIRRISLICRISIIVSLIAIIVCPICSTRSITIWRIRDTSFIDQIITICTEHTFHSVFISISSKHLTVRYTIVHSWMLVIWISGGAKVTTTKISTFLIKKTQLLQKQKTLIWLKNKTYCNTNYWVKWN